MNSHSEDSFEFEEARIKTVYAARQRGDFRYSWFNPGYVITLQEIERKFLSLMCKYGIGRLDTKKIFELGCGTGFWLREFIKWGAQPDNITGLDLLQDRVEQAKKRSPNAVRIECGSATKLEFPNSTFDIILQATVFTSILDDSVKKQVAAEMMRVLKPDGLIFWYDYHVDNPWNPNVRGVRKKEIFGLFPGCKIDFYPITLAPPLVRILAPYSWLACFFLGRIPWLCTHYLGVIRKDKAWGISKKPR